MQIYHTNIETGMQIIHTNIGIGMQIIQRNNAVEIQISQRNNAVGILIWYKTIILTLINAKQKHPYYEDASYLKA